MPTLLRVLIKQRDWTSFETFRAQYERCAAELAEREKSPHLKALSLGEATFERWYLGKVTPFPDARRVLTYMFGYPISELLAPAPDLPRDGSDGVPTPDEARSASPCPTPGAEAHEMGRQVAMAADRALRFAVAADGNQIGQETMDHVSEEVRRLAQAYPRAPLSSILNDLTEIQDLTFRLLESNRTKPRQARELHLLAAMSAGMLAKAAHDLGDPGSAMRQARAAYVCADQADHSTMRAWVRGLQSLISYWHGRHNDAAHYAANGVGLAPANSGTISVWLACLEARAQALLGDTESVRLACQTANNASETGTLDELDRIGGIFTFPTPRRLYYVAEAEVLSSEPVPAREVHAKDAVRAYQNARPDEWAFGDEAGAHTNLALARIAENDLDGAVEAVRPVLDLPAEQHNNGIILSAQRVHRAVTDNRVSMAPTARELRAEIEVFASTPVRALPH